MRPIRSDRMVKRTAFIDHSLCDRYTTYIILLSTLSKGYEVGTVYLHFRKGGLKPREGFSVC